MKIQLKYAIALVFICTSFPSLSETALAQSLAWPAGQGCTYISSDYGQRGASFHSGIDIACGGNIDILAAASGTVVKRTWSSGQCAYSSSAGTCPVCDNHNGNSVRLQHDGSSMQTNYLHMREVYVSVGDHVNCGQVIGKMGTTGCSTGQHLHFMVYPNGSNHASPWNYVQKGNYTCPVICDPQPEVCDGKDNDCDGAVDEDEVCSHDYEVQYQSMNYDMQNTDIDGDGKSDICARGAAGIYCTLSTSGDLMAKHVVVGLSDEQGWGDVSNYATIRFADVNGDDIYDICARADVGLDCWASKGNGEFVSYGHVPMADGDGYNQVKYYSTIKFADINGDGKDDFCARFKEQFQCYLSNGNGFDTNNPIGFGDMGDGHGWGEERYFSTIRVADVNGDGKLDVCGRGGSGIRCWLSKGTSFADAFHGPAWSDENGWGNRQYYTTIRFPDINGDRKADLCARDSAGIICHLSNGNSFGDGIRGPEWSDHWGWNDYDNYSTIQYGDINGDGKDDLCGRANANFVCHLSTGTGFADAFSIDEFSDGNGWNKPDKFRTIRLGDVNGDGKLDVCSRTANNVSCYSFNGSGFDHIEATGMEDQWGWSNQRYYSTFRVDGMHPKACKFIEEVCDGIDNNCDGRADENNVCCVPTDEICDGKDNDCDGEIDEGDVCCVPSEEICDGIDNDCDDEIDEGDVCCSREICDGLDNDCDGEVDEDNVCCEPSKEICDGIDNDCDGKIDEGGVCPDDPNPECDPDKEDCDGEEVDPCPSGYDEDGTCIDDYINDTGVSLVYDEDCACSSTQRTPRSLPFGAVFTFLGLFGGLLMRRRKDYQNRK